MSTDDEPDLCNCKSDICHKLGDFGFLNDLHLNSSRLNESPINTLYIQKLFDNDNRKNESSPTRVAAQVVSGIGVLGAVIMRDGLNIRGLNTAAKLCVPLP